MSGHVEQGRLQALIAGAEPSDAEATHLLDCDACADAMLAPDETTAAARLREAFGDMRGEVAELDELSIERGHRRLVGAMARPRRVRRFAAAAGALVLAASVALFVRAHRPPSPPPASFAAVTPEAGARLAPSRVGDDEVVGLRGQAAFAVEKLPKGARFRVRAKGDEVEVRGTRFRVRADDDGVAAVDVDEGVVEVRTVCCGTTTLRRGEAYRRPHPTQDAPPPSAAASPNGIPSAAASANGVPPATTSAELTPVEKSPTLAGPVAPSLNGVDALARLQAGRDAYDAGRFGEASSLLDAAVAADLGSAWARDARTLSGAARVMSAPLVAVPALSVSIASFDAAAQRAVRSGDPSRAAAARLGAARKSRGSDAQRRWCALRDDPQQPPSARHEAERGCAP